MNVPNVSGPEVSIVTVCYNEKNNIRKTCESVTNQSFKNTEWIVIDGGSKDGTIDTLRKYQEHMAYLVSEKDSGIYNAMNKGIARAKGKYLLFLNGGDYLRTPQILEEVFVHSHDADILYGDICLENGKLHKSLSNLKEVDFKFFLRPQSLNHQAAFIKRSLFDQYGSYDESFKYAADYDWFLRVFSQGHNVIWKRIDHVVSIFDPHGMSESKKYRTAINHEIMRAQDKYDIPLNILIPARISFFLHRCLWQAYITYVFIKKLLGKSV